MLDQNLRTAKVAELQYPGVGIEEEVLRLYVSVADPLRMDICQRAEKLVDVQFYFEDRHRGPHLVEVPGCAVHCLGDILEDEIEVDFILLWGCQSM